MIGAGIENTRTPAAETAGADVAEAVAEAVVVDFPGVLLVRVADLAGGVQATVGTAAAAGGVERRFGRLGNVLWGYCDWRWVWLLWYGGGGCWNRVSGGDGWWRCKCG